VPSSLVVICPIVCGQIICASQGRFCGTIAVLVLYDVVSLGFCWEDA
jgi:hypothetical protein